MQMRGKKALKKQKKKNNKKRKMNHKCNRNLIVIIESRDQYKVWHIQAEQHHQQQKI